MSHFSVLVVTDQEPTQELLEEVLLPFHEYERTGIEMYLQDVDVTDEVLEQYNQEVPVVILSDGSTKSAYDGMFYRQSEPLGLSNKVLPEGATEKTLSADEARACGLGEASMKTAAESYFGSSVFEREGRWYRRTNPNAKWDWWVRGGRYMGRLLVKNSTQPGFIGRPGAFDNEPLNEEGVDSCLVGNFDLPRMQENAAVRAAGNWDKFHAVVAGRTWKPYEAPADGAPYEEFEAAREAYRTQPVVRDLFSAGYYFDIESFNVSRSEYADRAARRALVTYAVLKDGKWYERGKMGWWGIATDEKAEDKWDDEFQDLLLSLRNDQWLTIVDCHI